MGALAPILLGKQPENTAPRNKGGRPKGSPNKYTAAIKDMVHQALINKGGVKYLMKQADENPVAFLGLVGKTLPLDANFSGNIIVTIRDV